MNRQVHVARTRWSKHKGGGVQRAVPGRGFRREEGGLGKEEGEGRGGGLRGSTGFTALKGVDGGRGRRKFRRGEGEEGVTGGLRGGEGEGKWVEGVSGCTIWVVQAEKNNKREKTKKKRKWSWRRKKKSGSGGRGAGGAVLGRR